MRAGSRSARRGLTRQLFMGFSVHSTVQYTVLWFTHTKRVPHDVSCEDLHVTLPVRPDVTLWSDHNVY